MSACAPIAGDGPADLTRMLLGVDCQAAQTTADAFARLFGPHGSLGPVLTALLTLYVAFLAFGLLTGRSGLSLTALTPRMAVLGLALTFVTSWVAYQSVLWNLLAAAPDQVASLILGTRGSATLLFAGRLDQLFRMVLESANAAQAAQTAQTPHTGSFSPADLLWLSALMLMLGTVGLLIVARIALAAMLALGPLFILLALFRPTRGLFEGWLKTSVLFAIMPLLTVLIGGGALELLEPSVAALSMGGEISAEPALTVFLGAAIYLALLAMALKAATTLVNGWRPGESNRARRGSGPSMQPAAPPRTMAPERGRQVFSDQDRARSAMASLAMSAPGGSARTGALQAAAGKMPLMLPAAAPTSSPARADDRVRPLAGGPPPVPSLRPGRLS